MIHIARLDHVSINMPAGQENTARGYYTGLLGLAEIPKPNDGNSMDGCWFDLGAQQLHMLSMKTFAPERKAHPAFVVKDLAELRKVITAQGYPIGEFLPSDGRERFFSEDPFGSRLEFMCERLK